MSTSTVVNGALAVHHTATVDTPWDGPAAVAAMPNDAAVLKYCHAWQDGSGKPDNKSSYKMPHHKTEGGPANLAACRNGLARLAGSTIPAADKPGVERHLKAHLSDGGADEPDADDRYAPLILGRHRVRNKARDWFTIRNASGDGGSDGPAQVYIYDEIGGGGWFGGGITAADFVGQLNDIKNSAIDLHINSPGGDVFDAVAIYNAIRRHPAKVTSYVDGLAASAASFIAQAGDKVLVERNAQFMVHDASGFCIGNAADMRKMVDLLDKASDNIADIYAQRTGVDTTTWRAVMKEEAWYSADEAVTAGLADEVVQAPVEDERLTVTSRFDMSVFGYRYRNRSEAPDPVAVRRSVVTGRVPAPGQPAESVAGVDAPVEDLGVVPVGTPAAREREPIAAVVSAPTVTWTAPASMTTTVAVPSSVVLPITAVVADSVPTVVVPEVKDVVEPVPVPAVFDAEAFRAAVRAAVTSS